METALLPDVLHSQGQLRLMAGDSFVLGAVVHILAPYVLHQAHSGHISHEECDLHHALKNRAEDPHFLDRREESHDEFRQEDEQSHSDEHSQEHAHHHGQLVDGLVAAVLGLLLLQLLLGHLLFSGLHHVLVALRQRDDEVGTASHKGDLLIPGSILSVVFLPGLQVDSAVGQPAGHCACVRTQHHYALHQSLTADLRLEFLTALLIGLSVFFSHIFS